MEGKTAPGRHGLETLCGEQDPKLGLRGGQEVDGKGKGVSRAGRLGPGSPGRQGAPQFYKEGASYSNSGPSYLRCFKIILQFCFCLAFCAVWMFFLTSKFTLKIRKSN